MKENRKRITTSFTLPEEIVAKIAKGSEENAVTKSAYVSMILSKHFKKEEKQHAEADQ